MAKTILYWITTALLALALLAGGAADLARRPEMVEAMSHLGYPLYVLTILGFWKLPGGIVLLLPGCPRVKEWAYAGVIFELTGAAASHAASGDDVTKIGIPTILAVLAAVSWALRPAGRKT